MSMLHSYVSQKINTINSSPYGATIRTAITDALAFIDDLLVKGGNGNTFVVCTQDEYDSLTSTDKTADVYFIVEEDS